MNCCQPRHPAAPPLHAGVVKNWLLICSVKALAAFGLLPQGPDTVARAGVTLSKLPVAEEIFGPDTTAEMSLPLPTTLGLSPPAGGFRNFDGWPQGTSRHSRLG
jgi:hypothetical protein